MQTYFLSIVIPLKQASLYDFVRCRDTWIGGMMIHEFVVLWYEFVVNDTWLSGIKANLFWHVQSQKSVSHTQTWYLDTHFIPRFWYRNSTFLWYRNTKMWYHDSTILWYQNTKMWYHDSTILWYRNTKMWYRDSTILWYRNTILVVSKYRLARYQNTTNLYSNTKNSSI